MKKLLVIVFVLLSLNCMALLIKQPTILNIIFTARKYPNGTIDTIWIKYYHRITPRTDKEAEPIIRYYNDFYDNCKVIPPPKTIHAFTPSFVK